MVDKETIKLMEVQAKIMKDMFKETEKTKRRICYLEWSFIAYVTVQIILEYLKNA